MSQAELFGRFIAKFPPVDLPVTLGEETHHVFSAENEQFSDEMIAVFLANNAQGEPALDEYTEYVPCFALKDTQDFLAVVWWKASLMLYEYVLATYTKEGQPIARRVIAYTRAEGERIERAVATIDEEWIVYIAAGAGSAADDYMEPGSSRMYDMEIMANGAIV